MLVSLLVMNYLLELIMNLPNIPTIQKPNYRQFPELTMAGFTDALRPDKFTGVHFKRWQVKTTLWLTALKVFHASVGAPEGMTDEDRRKFQEANTMFVGCILSVLVDRLCDVYMPTESHPKHLRHKLLFFRDPIWRPFPVLYRRGNGSRKASTSNLLPSNDV